MPRQTVMGAAVAMIRLADCHHGIPSVSVGPAPAKQDSASKIDVTAVQPVESEAAQLNRAVMKKLQKAIGADPETDLASKLPLNYSSRLADRKRQGNYQAEDPRSKRVQREKQDLEFPKDDVRNKLVGSTSANVIFPLAESIQNILRSKPLSLPLADELHGLIRRSAVLWKPQIGCHKIVLSADPEISLKIIRDMDDMTEYTTLQYLEKHLPGIPAPRPLGLVALGDRYSLLFMSLMPGTTLEAVWSTLDHSLKCSVQEQLNSIFTSLRSFRPFESETPLGGVAGESCKDLRRHVRYTKVPIWTVKQFDDWQFSNPHFGSSIYIEALRRLSPPFSSEIVLSHNDLRPDNITVELKPGECRVTGILDWQYSGFYPTYYESTKVMNSIAPNATNDWYSYIPECISAEQNPQKFLLDALWWKFVE